MSVSLVRKTKAVCDEYLQESLFLIAIFSSSRLISVCVLVSRFVDVLRLLHVVSPPAHQPLLCLSTRKDRPPVCGDKSAGCRRFCLYFIQCSFRWWQPTFSTCVSFWKPLRFRLCADPVPSVSSTFLTHCFPNFSGSVNR